MLKNETTGNLLRIYVEPGGCSGLEYGLIFDEPREKDRRTECYGVQVLVDEFSMNYLRGALVEFSDDLNKSKPLLSKSFPEVAIDPFISLSLSKGD